MAPAALAWAEDDKKPQEPFVIVLALLGAVVPVQFLLAMLMPAFTRRVQRAVSRDFWTCAGWGGLTTGLFIVIALIFGSAGEAAKSASAGVMLLAVALSLAGALGVSKALGDWAFRRWGETPPGLMSVFAGSVLWFFGAMLPIVGWTAGLLTLFAGLGATVLVLLDPTHYDHNQPATAAPIPPAARPLVKLSVIIPVYNEQTTVREVIERVKAVPLPMELIVVDDGSTDGTQEILREEGEDDVVRVYTSPTNFGKGAAIRIGLSFVTGDVVIIQDADLELDPEEYPRLLGPILAGRTNVVYGSRFLHPTPGVPARTRWANRMLARLCNLLYRSRLTDVSTAYKVFRTETIRQITLKSVGFEFCAEVTAKLLRRREPIEEVPVGYRPRSAAAGKKLNYLTDGARAAWWLLWLRFAPLPGPPEQ